MDDDDKNWPKWFYGPKGEAEVIETEADVPEGWVDHPSKLANATSAEHLDL